MATGFGNAAMLGGAADPRLGDEADNIGKGRNGSIAANIHDSTVQQGRRRSVIYNDTSIEFEDYHYWANRSREYEKHIDVSGFGLQNLLKVSVGKGSHAEKPVQQEITAATGSDSEPTVDEKTGTNTAQAESRYGITESGGFVCLAQRRRDGTDLASGTTHSELFARPPGDPSST